MKILKTIPALKAYIRTSGNRGRLGLVPTMGYLHDGHLSLIRASIKENNETIVTIFINPTQFGPNEDLTRYPQDLNRDIDLLKKENVTALFCPQARTMYQSGYDTWVSIPGASRLLCGRSRPDHFQGVLTIVLKLFNLVKPNTAYFGKKDYQQYYLISKMCKELHLDLKIKGLPIVREPSGLALSSRNSYFTPNEQKKAALFHQTLKKMKTMALSKKKTTAADIITFGRNLLSRDKHITIDYLEIFNKQKFAKASKIDNNIIIVGAIYLNKVRLIDNIEMED